MPVSYEKRAVFIHIPKTGGMSVTRSLRDAGLDFDFCGEPLNTRLLKHPDPASILAILERSQSGVPAHIPQDHLPATVLRSLLDEPWDHFYKFSFVRNPWDKEVSRYWYLRRLLAMPEYDAQTGEIHDLVRRSDTFEKFMELYPIDERIDMSSYLVDESGADLVDFVGRVETLEADFASVCKRLGLPAALVHINRSERTPSYAHYYTPKTQAAVARRFARDIDRFGYRFSR
jgi:hypothetical protein